MKIAIKVLNEKHNRITQELLFAHGYSWCGGGDTRVMGFNENDPENDSDFVPNSYIEIDFFKNKGFAYCAPNQNKNRWADTFMNLKQLKEHLTK